MGRGGINDIGARKAVQSIEYGSTRGLSEIGTGAIRRLARGEDCRAERQTIERRRPISGAAGAPKSFRAPSARLFFARQKRSYHPLPCVRSPALKSPSLPSPCLQKTRSCAPPRKNLLPPPS